MVCNIFIFFLLASSIERHSDSPFPSQKASVRISATHIAGVLLLAEDVAAKHESPDLSPGPAILDGKAIDSTWLAHVDELWKAVLMLGIGGDASWYLDARTRRVRQVCEGEHVIKDAVVQPSAFLMHSIAGGHIAGVPVLDIFVPQPSCFALLWRSLHSLITDDSMLVIPREPISCLSMSACSLVRVASNVEFTLPNIPKSASFCIRFSKMRVRRLGCFFGSADSSTGKGS